MVDKQTLHMSSIVGSDSYIYTEPRNKLSTHIYINNIVPSADGSIHPEHKPTPLRPKRNVRTNFYNVIKIKNPIHDSRLIRPIRIYK